MIQLATIGVMTLALAAHIHWSIQQRRRCKA